MSKDAPLPTVGMAGQDQVYGIGDERKKLRMVREQDMIASLTGEGGKPLCFRLMIPGMNSSAYTADAFLTWITVGTTGFGSESSIVRNVTGGQTGKNNLFPAHSDRSPVVVKYCHAGGADHVQILLVQHPLVVTQGEEGRGEGSTGCQEG